MIPYYKINFFRETLASLAAQTDLSFRVYIGDDASPDDPAGIIEEYKNKLNITYKRFDNNLGGVNLVKQWERCCSLMQDEDWMMILGDDDYVSNNMVEMFYKSISRIEELEINLVRCATVLVNESGAGIGQKFLHQEIDTAVGQFYEKMHGRDRSSLSEHIFKTQVYREKGFRNYDLAWHADDMAWLDFTNGGKVFSVNDAVVFVRISRFNISGSDHDNPVKEKASFDFYTAVLEEFSHLFKKDQVFDILYRRDIIGKKLGLDSSYFKPSFYLKYGGAGALLRHFKRRFT